MKKRLLSFFCLFVAGCLSIATHAQVPDPTVWGVAGDVNAIVRDGNTLYIGGTFTYVGANTGCAAMLNPADGKLISPLALQLSGIVEVAVPDGS
ncbi:MAG TPA: hypothetical protein VF646_01065, partial [Cytophagales bacterium]